MLKETTSQLSGNDRYEGFGIDVIDELSKILGFNYTFVEQEDNNYGTFDKTKNEWNGMIRELLDGVSPVFYYTITQCYFLCLQTLVKMFKL